MQLPWGIPLVVPCVSRLVRSEAYDPRWNPNAKPTVAKFKAFLKLAKGVTILTLNIPIPIRQPTKPYSDS